MAKENAVIEFKLKKIDKTINYILEEIKHNELMGKKHGNICTSLNYFEHLPILTFVVTGFVSISAFAALVGIPVGITSSAVGLKICAITAEIIKKKKKHDKTALLTKTNLNAIEVLISKVLINLYINYDEFVSVKNIRRQNKRRNQKS